jgi:outer membrane protein OmpA-like peptidoglycan-associated protein
MRAFLCLVLGTLLGSCGEVEAMQAPPTPSADSPVSLTGSDGSGLTITSFVARGVVDDPLAFTELHLTFHNPQPRPIEGRFAITLPPGAAVSRFAMKQAWGWQEGEVVELQAARVAYEDFLHRRQDPALLEKAAGNQFTARVFPIPASGDKELILSYSQELTRAEEPYQILLHGLPRVDTLDIRVLVGKRTVQRAATTLGGVQLSHETIEVQKSNYLPTVDFAVTPPAPDGGARLGLRHENLVVARITPVTEAAPDRPAGLVVLFDTSASRALGFGAQVARLAELLDQLRHDLGAQTPLKLACFDQEVAEIYEGSLGQLGEPELRAIHERRALGASDLGRALAWVGGLKDRRWSRLLLVTDGIATAGPIEGQELRAAIAKLANGPVQRMDALVTGGLRDEAGLKRLVTGGLPHDGVVLDDGMGVRQIARRLESATYSGIGLSVPHAGWVWPTRLDGIQPGDQVLVYADLPADEPLTVRIEGALAGQHPVRLARTERPLLERAWVAARIQRLMQQRETLAAKDADLRAALVHAIVDLSRKHRVLSDFTGLLVLETEQDYARFGIDRRALTDVMTVGAGGIELMHRTWQAPIAQTETFTPPPPAKSPPRTRALANDPQAGFADESLARPRPEPQRAHRRSDALDDLLDGAAPTSPRGAANGASVDTPVTTAAPPPAPVPAATPVARPPVEETAGYAGADNDHDGIPDSADRCPNEPETYNGFEDDDGCPDRGRVILRMGRIEILDKVYFASGHTELKPVSLPILRAMAATLNGNPSITLVEVQGHTDEREPARAAQTRAEAVKRWLTQNGVAANRLVVRSYGGTRPVCAQHDEPCRARNRRVEFLILQRSDAPVSQRLPPIQQQQPPPSPPQPTPPAPGGPSWDGRFAEVMRLLGEKHRDAALREALAWRDRAPGDVLALVALGESWEAAGDKRRAARAYGSLIDLFPGRADLRRFAGERLERLGQEGLALAIDSYKQAKAQRADHPASHRLLAWALYRAGQPAAAFDAILDGVRRSYPSGRFLGVDRILREDIGLIAAGWIKHEPARRAEIARRMAELGAELPSQRSLRFVLNWETDANDVDFHIKDGRGDQAWYQSKHLPSGGDLYADVTTGYGPECFTIPGAPAAYPYQVQAHYYSRGPMGYGMGKLEIIEHDGAGGLRFEERPFVIMTDHAYVDLGQVRGPL